MISGLQDRLEKTLSLLKGQAVLKDSHFQQAYQEIQDALIDADVPFQTAKDLLKRVQARAVGSKIEKSLTPYQQFLKVLRDEVLETFGPELEFDLSVKPPAVVLMVGLQGTGKTTSSAKLALYAKRKLKRKPLLVSVDVRRPAAIEQLERLAEDSKIDVYKSDSLVPKERAIGALKYAQTYGLDLLIVDTAGRLSIDEALMTELAELKSILQPKQVLYVADAMSGQAGVDVAKGFASQIGLTGAILSKTDADSRGGVALGIRDSLSVPLFFVGAGERAEAFEPFFAKRWVSRILGLGDLETLFEKAQELAEGSEEKMAEQAKKMSRGQLTLTDFQSQMRMMSKMGSMSSVMGMIPGMGAMVNKVNFEEVEKKLKRVDAMINSMTKAERDTPDLINGDRKRRITRGSGTQVEELNQFLKEFYEMQKMMKRFSGGKGMRGLGAMMGRGR